MDRIRDFLYQLIDRFRDFNWWQKTLTVLAGLLLFVFFMDWVVMPLYTRHGSEYELPDVTEKNVDNAMDILDDNGFIPIVQDSVFDSFYPVGTVVRQNPTAFSTVKRGRRVYLIVSSGEKPIFMPKLVSETLVNARLKLREVGIEVGRVDYDYSERYPYREVVIAQSVAAGEQIYKSQAINLTVSLGPPPSSLVMPNLAGKSLESAKRELEVLGLSAGKLVTRLRYMPNLVPNTVISQSVATGTTVSEIETLELVISTDQIPQRDNGRY